MEKTNARDLFQQVSTAILAADLIVIDCSFISLQRSLRQPPDWCRTVKSSRS